MTIDFEISIEKLKKKLNENSGFHIRIGSLIVDNKDGLGVKSNNVAPCCVIGGYGKLDLGFFSETRNFKTGIVPVDELRLAAFGLTKEELMKGLKELSRAISIGLLASTPVFFMNLEKLIDEKPYLGIELQKEKEDSIRTYSSFREEKFNQLRGDPEYSTYSDDDLDDIIFETYKTMYPQFSEAARKTEEFLNQDLGDFKNVSNVSEEKNKQEENLQNIPSRGYRSVETINGKKTKGYYLNSDVLARNEKEVDGVFSTMAPWFNDHQKEFFKDFFKEIGLAESCYIIGNNVFSIEKQINGSAYGFVQIEPQTALSVLDEALSGSKEYAETINSRVINTLGMDILSLKNKVKKDPRTMLNNNSVASVIFYLKFANRSFAGIPNFKNRNFGGLNHNEKAKIWKEVWNTSQGSGGTKDYINKNKIHQSYM